MVALKNEIEFLKNEEKFKKKIGFVKNEHHRQ